MDNDRSVERGPADFFERRAELERLAQAVRESEIFDVQVLDSLAEIEALLRHARELQRNALRVRGVLSPSGARAGARQDAAAAMPRLVSEMLHNCATLVELLHCLEESAETICRLVTNDECEDPAARGPRE